MLRKRCYNYTSMFLLNDDYWEIRKTHKKGLGVFAKKEIKRGTVIGDYIGKVLKTAEYDPDLDKGGLYLMYLTDEASIYPDVTEPGTHLLNHSCNPNCWIYAYHGHTLFFALRKIMPQEELTISYLLSPKTDACDPCIHICKCESEKCRGTMHLGEKQYEKWQEFQDGQKTENISVQFAFGRSLPKLASYPKTIFIHPIYKEMSSA